MKITSTCERRFITNCILKKQMRLDGRQLQQSRTLEIVFGKERGCCMVLLGNTRVLALVSCEITEPKTSTPTEGTLHINFELSSMAAPEAKSQSRSSEEAVEAQRSLERCIRDCKAVDLESLCIITGSKVWMIRLDIHTLNDDGNLIESASVAAISALAHFRRPEVTVVGTDVTLHSVEEKDPVALNLHHMPVSINLALFDQGKHILVDPTGIEEKVCDGCYIMGMNAHQEICYVHRRGVLLLKENDIQRCEDVAVKRAQEVTQMIRAALDDDAYKRATNAPIGFTDLIKTGTILGAKRPIAEIDLDSIKNMKETAEPEVLEVPDSTEVPPNDATPIDNGMHKKLSAKVRAENLLQREGVAFEGGPSKWAYNDSSDMDDDSSSEEEDSDSVENPEVEQKPIKNKRGSDSEEETVYVHEDQLDVKNSSSRGWYSKDPFQ